MSATDTLEHRMYRAIFEKDAPVVIADHTLLRFVLLSTLSVDDDTGIQAWELTSAAAPGYANVDMIVESPPGTFTNKMAAVGAASNPGSWTNTTDLDFGTNTNVDEYPWPTIVGFGIREDDTGPLLMVSPFASDVGNATFLVEYNKKFIIPASSLVINID